MNIWFIIMTLKKKKATKSDCKEIPNNSFIIDYGYKFSGEDKKSHLNGITAKKNGD